MLHCRVRSCWRVTRYKIDLRKLPVLSKFAEVIIAHQAALWVHYLKNSVLKKGGEDVHGQTCEIKTKHII